MINLTLPDSVEQYIHRIGRVGRSDAIGLSFSLVSVHEEKVWYHTCNKIRNRRGTCHNTRLTSEGGCCIWMDEMKLAKAIEKQIEMTVPVLKKDLTLPEGIDLGLYEWGKGIRD